MTLFKNYLDDFCILWYVSLWINIILKNSIKPNIQFFFLCVEEAWGGVLGLDPESPLQSKVLMKLYVFVIIGGWQFCFWPKGILLFVCLFVFFALCFFFCEFLSGCSVGFLRINEHNVDSTSW